MTTAPWERLVCGSCFRPFNREIRLGRKPKRCGDCEAARRAPASFFIRPKLFQKVWLYGERLTILHVGEDRIRTHDDADARIEVLFDRMTWDAEAVIWTVAGHELYPAERAQLLAMKTEAPLR